MLRKFTWKYPRSQHALAISSITWDRAMGSSRLRWPRLITRIGCWWSCCDGSCSGEIVSDIAARPHATELQVGAKNRRLPLHIQVHSTPDGDPPHLDSACSQRRSQEKPLGKGYVPTYVGSSHLVCAVAPHLHAQVAIEYDNTELQTKQPSRCPRRVRFS